MIDRYKRQSFLGSNSEAIYGNCLVAIVGLGGGGSHFVQQFAHQGVGNFRLIDPDRVEESNLNRLVGARASDVHKRTRKTAIASRLIKGINPLANVKCLNYKWQEAHAWLRDCDVIIGCLDTYSDRAELEMTARRYLIPYIDIGMDVHEADGQFSVSGQVILSMPGGLCMRCLGFLRDELLDEEAKRYGAAGDHPQVIWANGVLASIAVGMFTQLFTPWQKGYPPIYQEYDGNMQSVVPSNRLLYAKDKQCSHFQEVEQLGDPFWIPRKIVVSQENPIKGDESHGEGRQENRIS
jgi:molybdopterin-synthase adenylyltransferase